MTGFVRIARLAWVQKFPPSRFLKNAYPRCHNISFEKGYRFDIYGDHMILCRNRIGWGTVCAEKILIGAYLGESI